LLKELSSDAEYAVEGEWWLPGMNVEDSIFGSTANYVQACKKLFGEDYKTAYQTSAGSAAGSILQIAIEQAGTIETEKVREVLTNLEVELATWPAIVFNEKGENIRWEHPVVQVQDGEFVIVYPEESQESKPLYPAPAWKDR